MGFWYMLLLFIGICLFFAGILPKRGFPLVVKIGLLVGGALCIGFSLFMFSPGSTEIMADLLGL
ncbi:MULTISPECIES: hypothetical protein [unclassified Planococcus (in: firmicutes)]|uniref:hypothetical protein n=1 Tax=Planococcus TaxID=1372 RepID=UPI000C330FAC|nr:MULTISPECIES: hypothetical protein [unclassified Planococcus (in: firmicutes)]AUD14342.1 hypothetical protein CW734_12735 [Planococcus sp. MB-3u-03]PKG46639.1 hypothetical protein CXF66_06085 [Planococcus sp. Urea-trap-24]PKG89508.1 hypothetical protein CXF91_07350 [Planococcus sp. Urea-3u-39]PKH42058.1 hypothetical protein CXF77_04970 [Planococcus sp. MB-3u-09]